MPHVEGFVGKAMVVRPKIRAATLDNKRSPAELVRGRSEPCSCLDALFRGTRSYPGAGVVPSSLSRREPATPQPMLVQQGSKFVGLPGMRQPKINYERISPWPAGASAAYLNEPSEAARVRVRWMALVLPGLGKRIRAQTPGS